MSLNPGENIMPKDIPLATQEWLEENCPPFTLPGRIAKLFAAKQARLKRQQEQDPSEPDRGEGESS